MKATLEKIIASPNLPLYFEELRKVVEDERSRREEFLNKITEDDKAEFINGQMIFHSPVRERHNAAVQALSFLLGAHNTLRGLGGVVRFEKALVSLTRNDYEPDVLFYGPEKAKALEPDQMRYPAPDFIVEVLSSSTAKNDRGVKFEDYAAHGIDEYWIIDPEAQTVEQYLLDGSEYQLEAKTGNGRLASRAVEGFNISAATIFDPAQNAQALQEIIAAATQND